MERGEIWWAEAPPPIGARPVVIVSRQAAIGIRELLIVIPVTTRIRRIPTETALGPEDGLPKRCVANADVLYTLPKGILRRRMAALSPAKLTSVNETLRLALGLHLD